MSAIEVYIAELVNDPNAALKLDAGAPPRWKEEEAAAAAAVEAPAAYEEVLELAAASEEDALPDARA